MKETREKTDRCETRLRVIERDQFSIVFIGSILFYNIHTDCDYLPSFVSVWQVHLWFIMQSKDKKRRKISITHRNVATKKVVYIFAHTIETNENAKLHYRI